ncbi:MAG: MFS transporter [Actinomycetota bacterium]
MNTEDGESAARLGVHLRHLAGRYYGPSLFSMTGATMLVPTLPVYLRDRADSFTVITLVLAAAAFGGTAANVPVGALVGRVGERIAFLGGLSIGAIGTAAVGFGTDGPLGLWLPFLCCAVAGVGSSARLVAHQSYARRTVAPAVRGRVMAVFGGLMRAALLIGPLLGGFLAQAIGFEATFVVAGAVMAVGLVPALIAGSGDDGRPPKAERPVRLGLGRLLARHGRVIGLTGLGQFGAAVVRVGRLTVLPLYAAAIGLDVGQIGVIVGLAGGLDLLLFPAAGWIMDRYGRLYAIIPSFLGLGIGLLLLPLAGDYRQLTAVSLIIGMANGIGSGTMLTLTTDLAPKENPAEFIGTIRLLGDSGRILGPLVVGLVADRLDLASASLVLGGVGVATAALFVVAIGEPEHEVVDGPPPRAPSLPS